MPDERTDKDNYRVALLLQAQILTDKYVVHVENAWLCVYCQLCQNQLKNTKK